jgi:hypothetical protein
MLLCKALRLNPLCYSVPHVAISVLRGIDGRACEYEVVLSVLAVEVAAALLTVYSFRLPVFY